jgi:hypothetical protein
VWRLHVQLSDLSLDSRKKPDNLPPCTIRATSMHLLELAPPFGSALVGFRQNVERCHG